MPVWMSDGGEIRATLGLTYRSLTWLLFLPQAYVSSSSLLLGLVGVFLVCWNAPLIYLWPGLPRAVFTRILRKLLVLLVVYMLYRHSV